MIGTYIRHLVYERCLDIAYARIVSNFSTQVLESRYGSGIPVGEDLLTMIREDIAYFKSIDHPAKEFLVEHLENMEKMLQQPSVVLVGTIKLDNGKEIEVVKDNRVFDTYEVPF